jgi:hypothetical protein
LLVWDPLDQRTITSGRQLFGNYTFQIFWRNGYEALRALDDDGDGQLTGFELLGLSVWFDRNGDGCSARDEVSSVFDLGIRALAVCATTTDGPHPMNPGAVTFRDGRILPTWDWIAEPGRRLGSGEFIRRIPRLKSRLRSALRHSLEAIQQIGQELLLARDHPDQFPNVRAALRVVDGLQKRFVALHEQQ